MPRTESTSSLSKDAATAVDHRAIPEAGGEPRVDFSRDVVCILGLPFDGLRLDQAAERVMQAAVTGRPCFISTPNINFLMLAQRRPAFRQTVLVSDLSLADGTPLIWIARLLRLPLPERVAGSDLFDRLRATSGNALRVYFFGGPPGAAGRARTRLNRGTQGMRAVGDRSPGFESVESLSGADHLDDINASGANFVVVSLGAEKGQAWIVRNRHQLKAPVVVHLGAVVNFVAGRIARAPMWMRRVGLEWVWRVGMEPVLWRRYMKDGMVLLWIILTRLLPLWRLQRRAAGAAFEAAPAWSFQARGLSAAEGAPAQTDITLHGALLRPNLQPLRDALAAAAAANQATVLHLDEVQHLDAAAMGLLLLLEGHLVERGKTLRLTGANAHVGAMLRYAGLGHLTAG